MYIFTSSRQAVTVSINNETETYNSGTKSVNIKCGKFNAKYLPVQRSSNWHLKPNFALSLALTHPELWTGSSDDGQVR